MTDEEKLLAVTKSVSELTTSVHLLVQKIDTLVVSHLKIIRWLILVISVAFVGTKATEFWIQLR